MGLSYRQTLMADLAEVCDEMEFAEGAEHEMLFRKYEELMADIKSLVEDN